MTRKLKRGTKRETPPPPELAFDPLEAALRQLFDDVAAEAVPDDFMQLVEKLEKKQPEPKPSQ